MFLKSFLSSSIAKRIFLFFFLVSALPIAIIAFISYQELSKQISSNLERQVFLDAKLFSQVIVGKFNNARLETNSINKSVINSDLKKEYIKHYSDIYIAAENNSINHILGVVDFAYRLSEQEDKFLEKNKVLVALDKSDINNQSSILFFNRGGLSKHNLIVRFDSDEFMRSRDSYCIESLDFSNRICNFSESLQWAVVEQSEDEIQKLVVVQHNKNKYLFYRYPLFLGATYSPNDIYVSTLLPLEDAYAPLSKFKSSFLSILVVSMLVILILAFRQISQTLTPLKLLKQSVEKIKNGDYGSTIKLNSNDEFQELSETFNEMSSQVHDHFELINSFSELDKIIFSNHDFEQIIRNIIVHLRRYLNNASIGVFIVDMQTNESAKAYLGFELPIDNIQETNVDMYYREIDELTECQDFIELTSHEQKVFLSFLPEKQNNNIKLFPLKNAGELIGILYINSTDEKIKSFEVNELKELASKVSIALTNSFWEKRLYIQANYDGLTGLANRYLLQDDFLIALEEAKKNNTQIGFLLIDLDHFKDVNDNLGHAVGDKLLIRVATMLNDSVLRTDLVTRYGGDEFIIILNESKENLHKKINLVIDNIYSKFKEQIKIDNYELMITPSIGAATYPNDGENFNDLLKNADAAMYHAKRTGRAKFEYYSEELGEENLRRLILEKDLRTAIANNELHLYYQPKIDSKTLKVIGMEALLRWKHKTMGLVPPEHFIQVAEETGVILNLTEWVLKTACQDLIDLQTHTEQQLVMSVNLSTKQFHNYPIVEFVDQLLYDMKLSPSSLDIEITETAAADDI